ncbi:MAG: segregation and condensation protein A [Candidatus Dormibacterales bacterium]
MEQPVAPPRLEVATPVFEGPLELLLALVEREELDVLEVPLASVTEAYLRHVAALKTPDPREMSEFLWMAARLLLLKSIRLLPGEEPQPQEVDLLGWEEEVRHRLQEYQVYREMAQRMMDRAAQEAYSFSPPARPVAVEGQEAPIEAGLLLAAFQSVLSRVPPRPLTVAGRAWTLEEKLDALARRLARGPLELVALILESEDRLEAVVTFVALLEMLRRGEVRVRQRRPFGPITVEPGGAPRA